MTPPPSQLPEWIKRDVDGFHAQYPLSNARDSAYIRATQALEIALDALDSIVNDEEGDYDLLIYRSTLDRIRKLGE